MSIKTWFNNLRKTPRKIISGFDDVQYHEERLAKELESDSPTKSAMAKYHGEKLVIAYKVENKALWWMLAHSLQQRKAPSREHVNKQLKDYTEALTAVIQRRMKGIAHDSEIGTVIDKAFAEEYAKLMYMFFDEIDLSVEDAEAKIAEYRESVAKEMAEQGLA